MKTQLNAVKVAATFAALALASVGTGCAANVSHDGAGEDPSVTTPVAAKPAVAARHELARVEAKGGVVVTFTEFSPGNILVEERSKVGATSVIPRKAGDTALDLYRSLTGSEPGDELKAAESRRIELRSHVVASHASSPPPVATKSESDLRKMRPMLTSAQTTFESDYCSSQPEAPVNDYVSANCTFGPFVTSPWSYTDNFAGLAEADPDTNADGLLLYDQWQNGGWVNLYEGSPFPPGSKWWFNWYTTGDSYNEAILYGAGQNSLATFTATPNVSAEYYANLYLSGDYWVHDSTVQLSSNIYGLEAEATVTNGYWSTVYYPWCVSYPPTTSVIITAKGLTTGQTATTTVDMAGCW